MKSNIKKLTENFDLATAFFALHPDAPGYLDCAYGTIKLDIEKGDAAAAGKYFGKDGWVRKLTYSSIDWTKQVDGIEVTICGAEDLNLNGSPVPSTIFPLELECGDSF